MKNIFTIVQIASAALTVVLILLQQKGTGLGSAFGGESYGYQTRRGAEKIIFRATIVFVALFMIASFLVTQVF